MPRSASRFGGRDAATRTRRSIERLVWALVLACPSVCRGQGRYTDDEYVVETWEIEDGLPDNSVTAMVQSQDGYLWFATFDGLVRFNGVSFEVLNEERSPGMPDPYVVNVHLDRRGRLWVSTLDGITLREDNRWRALGAADGWTGDLVRSFAEREDGAILTANFDGSLLLWTGDRFVPLAQPGDTPIQATCAADAQGRFWIASPQFIGYWDGERWNAAIAGEPGEGAACAPSRDGGVWVLTRAGEVRKFHDGAEVHRRSVEGVPAGVWSLFEDSRGYLWVATHDAGVCRIAPDGERRNWSIGSGLMANGVRFIFEDRERNIWIGTSGGGLSRFTARRVWSYGDDAGVTERVVNSVWPSPDGAVLVGTYGAGLFRLQDGWAQAVGLSGGTAAPRYVQSVLQDRSGRIWIGSFGQGLFIDDGSVVHRPPAEATAGGNVIGLFEDSRGRVWVAGGQGLSCFENGVATGMFESAGADLFGVCAIAEGREGELLLSTKRGVFALRNGQVEELLTPEKTPLTGVLCIRPDEDAIWLGTARAGLLRWTPNRLDAVDTSDGFPAKTVSGILQDDSGHWWMASERGILRADRTALAAAADGRIETLPVQILGVEDGMAGSECSGGRQPVCGRAADGRMWFATPRGVALVDPASFVTNPVAPPVLVERVTFEDHARRPEPPPATRVDPPFSGGVIVPAGSRSLEVRYAALSFTSPSEVRFQTRLDGAESAWRDVGRERSARYYGLPPGRYVFRVRAANNDGLWSEQGATLAVRVLPHFWETGWFASLAAASLVAIGSAGAWALAQARHRQRRVAAERFRDVVDAAPSAMVLVDPKGLIILANAQAEREFGYPRDELLGLPANTVVPRGFDGAPSGHRRSANERPARAMDLGAERSVRRKDGTEFPAEIRVTPIQSASGTGVLASIVNVTERKRAELELAAQRNELAHLSRVTMLGELSGSHAHELNQPLAAILSNAQAAQRHLAKDPIDTPEVREILADIVEQDKRAGEVIHRLRALLRKDDSRHQPLDVADVLADVLRLMRSDLINHGVQATAILQPRLPEIFGDRVQLQQVLLNLLLNACDAMADAPHAERRIEVRAEHHDGTVVLSVIDAGPGFAPGSAERLFEPFFTTKGKGMGLGLTVCRTIVSAHGGRIWAEAGPAGGATFRISLPVAPEGGRP